MYPAYGGTASSKSLVEQSIISKKNIHSKLTTKLGRNTKLDKLYIHTEAIHNLSSPRLVVPIVLGLAKPKSVLDVGCGIGTWLKAFEENGVSDYIGVDGNYVDRSLLKVPDSKFIPHDLRKDWSLERKFDLVVSLEVAEHLPEQVADQLIKVLINHGDTILFSAAIPGQGGQNHLNEQWPEYWQDKFLQHGYYFHDVIRPLIWANQNIEWWYKQNIFLVKKNIKIESLPFNSLSVVHPELFSSHKKKEAEFYQSLVGGKQGYRLALKVLINSIKFSLKKIFKVQ